MDLSVSPDLDAWICYSIVLISGVVAALGQLSKRLGGIEGIWFVARTWLLFWMYVLVPVVLFWLLDRTGAITDTSVFAALLVGFGYERIIAGGAGPGTGAAPGGGTGGTQTIRAPGEVSQFWTPFLAYADRVERLVRDRLTTRRQRLVERVVAEVMQDANRLTELRNLAMRFTPDVAALQQQIDEIDARLDALGENGVAEQKIRLLYGILVSAPDAHFLMKERKIISGRLYWQQIKRRRTIVFWVLVIAAVIMTAFVAARRAKVELNRGWATYYVWRLAKTNSTVVDQVRSRQKLVKLMLDPTVKDHAARELASLLRRPGLPIERVDFTLQTLLEGRAITGSSPGTAPLLTQALRSSSVDARVRINEALKLLARSCSTAFDEGASPWKPSDGDSTTALEERVGKWTDYWAAPCIPKPSTTP